MRRLPLRLIALVVSLAGCRDAVAPWSPPAESADMSGPYRLTWSAGHDSDPVWSINGDSVLYAGDGFAGLPPALGLLLRVPGPGGAASLVIPALQANAIGNEQRFAQPALSRNGQRIAFFELAGIRTPAPELIDQVCVPEPVLDSLVLRVRSLVAEEAPESRVSVRLAGIDSLQRITAPGPYVTRLFPFQREWTDLRELVLRPTWAPDGTRLAFSDGLRLFSWAPEGGAPEPIPGTDDGVGPAWSPDGDWIAYTRYVRPDSASSVCYIRVGNGTAAQTRWTYTGADPHVILVHPDGSGSVDIGVGRDPAWGPDGSLYFGDPNVPNTANGWIRVRSAAGTVSDVAPAVQGRWPALSPDGTFIAYRRFDSDGSANIWVARLER